MCLLRGSRKLNDQRSALMLDDVTSNYMEEQMFDFQWQSLNELAQPSIRFFGYRAYAESMREQGMPFETAYRIIFNRAPKTRN